MSGTIRVINTKWSVAANGKYSYLSLVAIKFRPDESQEEEQQQQELSNKKQLG